jgi:hypothetical protein
LVASVEKSSCPQPERVAGVSENIVHQGGQAIVSSVMQRFPRYPQNMPRVVEV